MFITVAIWYINVYGTSWFISMFVLYSIVCVNVYINGMSMIYLIFGSPIPRKLLGGSHADYVRFNWCRAQVECHIKAMKTSKL